MGRFTLFQKEDCLHAGRGLLMGAADIVPGVSGGTVALIVGIYHRLVTAVSHFDLRLLGMIRKRRWRKAVEHVDLRFLIALGCGIGAGILMLASLMHYLLEHHTQNTFAVFYGLIAASCLLVARRVDRWQMAGVGGGLFAALFAYWLCGQVGTTAELSYSNVFFSAVVAISAMILPGISGAFILLILGMYHHITGVIKDVASFQITLENLTVLAVFALGCAIGLSAFSRLLRILLTRYEPTTMAVLCGFMLGSLRRVWPFKQPREQYPPGTEFKDMDFVNVLPDYTTSTLITLGLLAAAFLFVFVADYLARRRPDNPAASAESIRQEMERTT